MLFLEQQQLAASWGTLGSTRNLTMTERDLSLISSPLSVMHCPSRRDPRAYPLIHSFRTRYGPTAARTDYAMSGGAAEPAGVRRNRNLIRVTHEGVWRLGSETRFRHVVDGLSNTYLIGEKAMDSTKYTTGNDFGDRSPITGWPDNSRAANSFVRFTARPPAIDKPNNCLSCHDFGSAHPATFNMSFSDGSVRAISYTIDIGIHRASASIQGNELESIHE